MNFAGLYVFTLLICASKCQRTEFTEPLSNDAYINQFLERFESLESSVSDLKQDNLDLKSKLEVMAKRLNDVEQLSAIDSAEDSTESKTDAVSNSVPARSQTDVKLLRGQRQVMSVVAFTTYLDHVSSLGYDQAVVFNKVVTNEGQGYSTNNGRFRAPLPGLYLFSWAVTAKQLPGQIGYNIWAKLMKNGNHMIEAVAESYTDNEDNQGSSTAVLMLSRGDEVWVAHEGFADRIHGDQVERCTSFTGVLLVQTDDHGSIVGK
ncbi:caprin-2-like [Mya arenaria]|uniref:caprin-2-like n=1 Tax=Mya arenaria TaxID=6604 RepID=UPI0022E01CE8|nr:caprin-2-like [Mya arenaria]